MLEKIFSAEIEAAISHQPVRGVFQTGSTKMIQGLKEKGMVIEIKLTLCGQFPVVVRGWALTPLGHFTYCMSCDDSSAD